MHSPVDLSTELSPELSTGVIHLCITVSDSSTIRGEIENSVLVPVDYPPRPSRSLVFHKLPTDLSPAVSSYIGVVLKMGV